MFRFTIRELLLLTLVVGLALGWWVHGRSLHQELRNQQDELYVLRGYAMSMRFAFDPERPSPPP